jgi:hypothetical protein
MNIRFTSSLTPDDENAMAPALLNAVSRILDLLPIAYMIRIETSDAQIYEHVGSGDEPLAESQRDKRVHPLAPTVLHRI